MSDSTQRPPDRRLAVAVGALALLGLVCLTFGIWGTVDPAPVGSVPVQVSIAPVGLVVAGVIFLGFALFELLRRLRHGPQKPGRHTRS